MGEASLNSGLSDFRNNIFTTILCSSDSENQSSTVRLMKDSWKDKNAVENCENMKKQEKNLKKNQTSNHPLNSNFPATLDLQSLK